jgi:hypothetical protein
MPSKLMIHTVAGWVELGTVDDITIAPLVKGGLWVSDVKTTPLDVGQVIPPQTLLAVLDTYHEEVENVSPEEWFSGLLLLTLQWQLALESGYVLKSVPADQLVKGWMKERGYI